jgi:hypothetical protein
VTITRIEQGRQRAGFVTARKLAAALAIPVAALEGPVPGERLVWFEHDLERVGEAPMRKQDI